MTTRPLHDGHTHGPAPAQAPQPAVRSWWAGWPPRRLQDLRQHREPRPQPRRRPLLQWLPVQAGERWLAAGGPQLGASIAFYTMFALAPLLVVTIAVAGLVFGAEAARGQIVAQIQGLVGPAAAQAIQAMIASAWREQAGGWAALLGLATLLVGATGVFAELRRAFNAIAQAQPRASALGAFVRVRLVAFALLLGCGFLAIVSLAFSAAVAALVAWLGGQVPRGGTAVVTALATLCDLAVSVLLQALAFAALLRWLPDQPPRQPALWMAALASAVLFALGKTLIGLYLGRSSVGSAFGAAGSFAVLMLWVYYSSQILLYGAALGLAWDERRRAGPSAFQPSVTERN